MALQLITGYQSDDDDIVEQLISPKKAPDEDEIKRVVEQVVTRLVNTVVQQEQQHQRMLTSSFTRGRYRTTSNTDEIHLSDSESDSSSWSIESDIEDDDFVTEVRKSTKPKPYAGPRTKGELTLDDLPPIEDLTIQCPTYCLYHIGSVDAVIERVITIKSFKGQPALNFDSVLFAKDGHPIGRIFDVFGPVKEPHYVIRFNHENDIKAKGITKDMPIYFSPHMQEPYTSYVFTKDLMTVKGSDASWTHNNEPPEDVKEFSDDEEEMREKRKQKRKRFGHDQVKMEKT